MAQVMKFAAEVGEIIVDGDVVLEAPDLGKLQRLVERDFGLRRLDLKGGVPGAAIWAVEPAAERMRVGEAGVDDTVIGNAKYQLAHPDAGQELVLGEQPVIGRVIEVEDMRQMLVVVGNAGEHADIGFAVFRGYEAVRVVAADERRTGWVRHMPSRRASSSRRTVCIAGTPPFIM